MGGTAITVPWDPIRVGIAPKEQGGTLTDIDPNRAGTQLRVYIDIELSGIPEGGFNKYLKFVSSEAIAAAGPGAIRDLDGKPISTPGWYDFTRRQDGTGAYVGDGARFVTKAGKIVGIEITITDNAFGDNDWAANRVLDPGVPVLTAPPEVTAVAAPTTLAPPPFRAEQLGVTSPWGDFSDRRHLEMAPLGLSPALVTGTLLAARTGTAHGFHTMPDEGTLQRDPSMATFSAPAFTAAVSSGDHISSLPSALLEAGSPALREGEPLYTARDPGKAEVLNGRETSLVLPRGIFGHVDRTAYVTVEARLGDGSPLPPWIRVNTESGRLTVAPPVGLSGAIEIRLTARDGGGSSAAATFTIVVRDREVDLRRSVGEGVSTADIKDPLDILGLFVEPSSMRGSTDTGDYAVRAAVGTGRAGLSHMVALAALERSPHSLLTAGANPGRT